MHAPRATAVVKEFFLMPATIKYLLLSRFVCMVCIDLDMCSNYLLYIVVCFYHYLSFVINVGVAQPHTWTC